ncbi:MAG: hypothetical protein HUN04_22300 [Desulfobacter sp.]|nr:MAG: hypothetical protein HUN04_22300 [Desulfobacter sp.]
MTAGIGALQSALGRVKKKLPCKNPKISVVSANKDGSVDFPDNCSTGILLVPAKMTELEWENASEN